MDFTEFLSAEHSMRTLALLVILLFMLIAVIKGIARMIVGMVCLAVAFVLGWVVFRVAPGYLGKWFGSVHPDAVMILSIACGLGAHLLLKKALRGIAKPGNSPVSGGDRLRHAVFSLIPATFLLWVIAMAVRWTGALALMQHIDEGIRAEQKSLLESPLFARIQKSLTDGWIGEMLNRTDPVRSTEAGALCSLLLISKDKESWGRLIRDPSLAEIVTPLARLSRGKEWTESTNYAELITLPQIQEALEDQRLVVTLRKLDIEATARHAIGATPAVE